MAITFDGGFGFTEADLPTITVRETPYIRYAESSDRDWAFDIDEEDNEYALRAVKAHLAYWLWRQRNPDLVSPVDEVAKADLTEVITNAAWEDPEDLAAILARAGFKRG